MSESDSEHEESSSNRLSPNESFIGTSIPRTPNLINLNLMRDNRDDEFIEESEDEFETSNTEVERITSTSSGRPRTTLNMAALEELIGQVNSLSSLSRWTTPSIPNNNLLNIVAKAEDVINEGSDVPGTVSGNHIQILLEKILIPLLDKVMYEEMNFSMEHNKTILRLIFRVITIFVTKLRQGAIPVDYLNPYWRIFHTVMNQNTRFYLKAAGFDIGHGMACLPGDIESPSLYFKKDNDYPDWYSLAFLWFIKMRGFHYIAEWAVTKIPESLPFEDHFHYVDWLYVCSMFKVEFNRTHILPFMKPYLEKMMRLTDEDINKSPLDFREANFVRSLFVARCFIGACEFRDDEENGYCARIHQLLLKAAVRSITSGNFIARLVALEELTRILVVPNDLCLNTLRAAIKQENIVEILYKDNLHHMAYVERVLRFMNLLLEKNLIDETVLEIIWDDQLGKHDAILRNVILLLSKISINFSDNFFSAFFDKLRKCWLSCDDKVKDIVLDLLRRVGSELNNQVIKNTFKHVKIIVDLLWNWSSDSKNDILREKIYSVMFDILQETVLPIQRNSNILVTKIVDIATSCVKANLYKAEEDPVALSLHFLKKLICLIPDDKESDEHNRRYIIRKLDKTFYEPDWMPDSSFTFGRLIAKNICHWVAVITPKLRDSPHNSMETDSTSSESPDPDDIYFIHLRKRLDFLHFLIVESDRWYRSQSGLFNSEWIYELWRRMINVPSNSLQTIGFRFFRDVVSTILENPGESDVAYEDILRFFNECVLKVNPTNLSSNGFRCFQQFLKFVNISKGVLRCSNSDLDDEDPEFILVRPDFEGERYLRRVIMYSDDLLHKSASSWLEKMYSSYLRYSLNEYKNNNIIVTKCVSWLEDVAKIRHDEEKSIGDRMVKNTLLAILEVVEKNESDLKLVIRQKPSLRRSIAIHGFKAHISFKADDMQMLFSGKLPPDLDKGMGIPLNDNLILYDLICYICNMLNDLGGVITPYPLTIVKKNSIPTGKFGSKLGQQEWGYTMREVGIREPSNMTIRTEKSKVAIDSRIDPIYTTYVSPDVCMQREQRMLSYQLAEHPNFISKLLVLADEVELLEYCFQLLASLPIKRTIDLDNTEAFQMFLDEILEQKSLSHRLYYLFVLYEHILPAKIPKLFDNSARLGRFYETDGVTTLLQLFSRLSTANAYTMDFEMFCCDILFRLVPAVLYIYLIQNEKTSVPILTGATKEMFENMKLKMDPFIEEIGKSFYSTTPFAIISYDLEILLSIVRAGSKFLSNSNGNIFYSAILESRIPEDDETLMEEENDPAEDQAEMMVFNCAITLSLLVIANPNKGRELLESPEFHKFLVDCCSTDSGSDYDILIPELFDSLESVLGTDHLIEGMIDFMFTKIGNGTSTYWKVLCSLIKLFYQRHNRPLTNIEIYAEETVEWLKSAQRECEETMQHYSSQNILCGRLKLAKVLLKEYPLEKRDKLMEKADNLIERILFVFLIPSSREYYLQNHRDIGMVRSLTTSEKVKDIDMEILNTFPRSTSCLLPTRTVAVCSSEESQTAAYDLLVTLAHDDRDMKKIVKLIMEMFYENRNGFIPWDYQTDNNLRIPGNFVGLKNGGATCYMNSILQQLFMLPEVRDPILQATLSEDISDQPYQVKILAAIQSVFANLAGSELEAYTPDEFWNIFQLNERVVNVHEQQDAYEFYNKVVDLIDEGMDKIGQQKIGTTIFGGQFADEKICKDCPHRYTREEPFTSISIDVRSHNNMVDSLNEFVRGDVLENDNAYHCETCDKKVRAVKRMTIKSLPEILVVQLKRFEFDWERNEPVKFNDYFEFPFSLDMSPYTTDVINARDNSDSEQNSNFLESSEFDQYNIYRLKGVVVHSGQATGGHYFSYIRSETNNWHKFDDTEVTNYNCEPQDVKHKWFGEEPSSVEYGRRRNRVWWNAFILFYERVTPPTPINKTMLTPLISVPGVPISIPLTVDANLPALDFSRRSSTASPVTKLHKRFSDMSLKCRSRFIPPRLETKVRSMNTRIMHEKNEFSYTFFEFMANMLREHSPRAQLKQIGRKDQSTMFHLLELETNFMFYTMIRSSTVMKKDATPFHKMPLISMYMELITYPPARVWFINNVVLNEAIARNYLLHFHGVTTNDKFIYIHMLAALMESIYGRTEDQKSYTVDYLLSISKTFHLSKALERRRNKSPILFDFLLEFIMFIYSEEYNEEMMMLIARLREASVNKVFCTMLRIGVLSTCIRMLDSYYRHDQSHTNRDTVLQVSSLLFLCFDFRSVKGTMHLEEYCPYMQVEEKDAVTVDECVDRKEIDQMLSNCEYISKYLELILTGLSRDNIAQFQNVVKVLCWNNFIVAKKLLHSIFKYLQVNGSEKADLYLKLLYALANTKDENYKEGKLLKWLIISFRLNAENFSGRVQHSISCFTSIKNEKIRHRILQGIVILLEAYGRPDDPNFDGPAIYDILKQTQEDFFTQMAEFYSKNTAINREVSKAIADLNEYTAGMPAIPPTPDDAKIRLLLKYREYIDSGDIASIDNSEESDMDTDDEVTTDNTDDQPLDLTIGGSTRSSVTTPMLAEKRTLLQDEDEPLNSPGDAKKSRYCGSEESEDTELLMTTSSSAFEVHEQNTSKPPPPYESNENHHA